MNTTTRTVRLFSATAALAITLGLLSTVCSIAAPQAGVLMAKQQQQQMLAKQSSSVKVAIAR